MKTPARIALVALTLAVAANGVVAAHAWRFTHFAPAGTRTVDPEAMSVVERAGVLAGGVTVPRPTLRRFPDGEARSDRRDGIATWTFEGSGRGTVLLFHGYGGAKSDLLDEAGIFHDLGWSAVLVDFPGSGESDGDTTTLGWDEAEVVAEVAARAGRPVVLYGKSMGAAAILRAVGELGVPADALVLENPYDRLVTTVGHRFSAMGLPRAFGPWLVFWGGVELGFNGFGMNPVEFAAHVRAPTLLMHGELDARVHLEEARAIEGALAGPKELVVFPGAGHVGLYAADAALWRASVTDFLARPPE